MSAAAKFFREQADSLTEERYRSLNRGHMERAEEQASDAAHHATAASALEALAVVADLFGALLDGPGRVIAINGFTKEQRAALATLGKIARGE